MALAEVGGAVSVAARRLGVSKRTLQRRLKEIPNLRPEPHNPLWDKAIDNRNTIEDMAYENLYSPHVSPFSKFWRHVDWDAYDLREARPRQLDQEDVTAFLANLETSVIVRIEYGRDGVPKFMPHLINRKL